MRKTRKWHNHPERWTVWQFVWVYTRRKPQLFSCSLPSLAHTLLLHSPFSVSLIILLILLSDSHTHIQDSIFSALGPSLLPTFIQPERESRDWAGSMVDFIIKRLLLFYGQGKLNRFLSAVWVGTVALSVLLRLEWVVLFLTFRTKCLICVFSWEITMYSVYYCE